MLEGASREPLASLLAAADHTRADDQAWAVLEDALHDHAPVSWLRLQRVAREPRMRPLGVGRFAGPRGPIVAVYALQVPPAAGASRAGGQPAPIDAQWVLLPPLGATGRATLGSPPDEHRREDDEAQRVVDIGDLLIARTAVTQRLWRALSSRRDRSSHRGDDLPAHGMSWHEARRWCDDAGLALPSEWQWEFACRAGTTTPFHVGATLSTDQANYDGNFPYVRGVDPYGEARGAPTPVACFPCNAFGLHAMHGNVAEWCADRYGDGNERVQRGGSWRLLAADCRSARRIPVRPGERFETYGLRPVAPLPDDPLPDG